MHAKVAILAGFLCLLAMIGGGMANAATASSGSDAASHGASALPAALHPTLYKALAHDVNRAYAIKQDGCATLPKEKLKACFDKRGVHFSEASGKSLALRLTAWGRGSALHRVAVVKPMIAGNHISYPHRNITEWWQVLPIGFEQGFTISKRLSGQGRLTLALAASGNIRSKDGALAFGNLRYGKLAVTDATGKIVPSILATKNGRILIAVNDTRSVYPLTVDPLVWIEQQKLIANDGAAIDRAGSSVALFGQTALLGAPLAHFGNHYNQGAVYIFSDSAGIWNERQKLSASDGASNDEFGFSVALSDTTILVGTPYATVDGNNIEGTVYVFSKSGGTWNQSQKLTPEDGTADDFFGYSIALSGTTAIITAIGADFFQGVAYIFTESDGTWSQVQKLTTDDGVADDFFGQSVALDNDTAVIGAYGATIGGNLSQGAAYVFTKSNGTWNQTQKLTADDGNANDFFGNSVALDNNIAVIGAFDATIGVNSEQGAAYIFTKANGVWSQTQKLTVGDGATNDYFGSSAALSSTMVLVGAPGAAVNGNESQGAAYMFTRSGGSWNQTQKLTASDGAVDNAFGSVAIEGMTALVGAPLASIDGKTGQGAGYVYRPACPQSYSERDATLNAGGVYGSLPYQAPTGIENGILGGPDGFQLYAQYSNGSSQHLYRIPDNEIHRNGPAGTYRWGVKAGNSGGAYVLCVLHP